MMKSISTELEELGDSHLKRSLRWVEGCQGRFTTIEGKKMLNFASNDYLGLANSEELKAAMIEGVRRWGVGGGASRLISGSMEAHRLLEDKICELKGTAAALSFANGYAAAVGTVSGLVGKGDTVILDKLSHASLIDGAKLSGATVRVFPHNGMEKLERLLESSSQSDGRVLVITESVFSMDGDLADLAKIVTLKNKYGALLLLDEAHALGVMGDKGMGLAEELGLSSEVDIHLGTLGKAAGVAGGFIAASQDIIDLVVNKGRSFIYSTSPPPAQAYTAMKALELIVSDRGAELRSRLTENVAYLSGLLNLDSPSAIFPWHVGESEKALALMSSLGESGYFVPAIRYPTVPRSTARLRITVTALHEKADLDGLAAELV